MKITDITSEDLDHLIAFLQHNHKRRRIHSGELLRYHIEHKLEQMLAEYHRGKATYLAFLQEHQTADDVLRDFPKLKHDFHKLLNEDGRFESFLMKNASSAASAFSEAPVELSGPHKRRTSTNPQPKKPARHGRTRGTLGAPIEVRQEEPLPASKGSHDTYQSSTNWLRQLNEVTHVLSYYEWENGLLSINREFAKLIPPIPLDQHAVSIELYLPQLRVEPYLLQIVRDVETGMPFLTAPILQEFFHYHLLAGAKIELKLGNTDETYVLRFFEVDVHTVTVLIYDNSSREFVFRELEIHCEVDNDRVLAESRFSNLEGLKRIDITDPRMAERVIWDAFESVGELDDNGRWIAEGRKLIDAVMQEKPYSSEYLSQILSGDRRWPYFDDHETRVGWFVRDDTLIGRSLPPVKINDTSINTLPKATSQTVTESRQQASDIPMIYDETPDTRKESANISRQQVKQLILPAKILVPLVAGLILLAILFGALLSSRLVVP